MCTKETDVNNIVKMLELRAKSGDDQEYVYTGQCFKCLIIHSRCLPTGDSRSDQHNTAE